MDQFKACLFGGTIFAAGITPAASATPGGRFVPIDPPGARVTALSPDGGFVGGYTPGLAGDGMLWARDGDMVREYPHPGSYECKIFAVADGGQTVAGSCGAYDGSFCGRYRRATVWRDGSAVGVGYGAHPDHGYLTTCPSGGISRMSADGSVLIGSVSDTAYSGPEYIEPILVGLDIAFPDEYRFVRPRGLSHDARTLVGDLQDWDTLEIDRFLWREDTGVMLPEFPGLPRGVSGDGRLILCRRDVDQDRWQEVLWSEETGIVATIQPPGAAIDQAFGINDLDKDASIATGWYRTNSTALPARGMVWTACDGSRPLHVWLRDHGVRVPDGWKLGAVSDVSADGTVFVGNGLNPDGEHQGWVVDLHAARAADQDADADHDIDDIRFFVDAYLAADKGADCNDNGAVEIDDIDCFVAAFLRCPI